MSRDDAITAHRRKRGSSGDHLRLKYCTARSCLSACARDEKVPRLRRRPVFGSLLPEYSR
jgi:hypothetical protein